LCRETKDSFVTPNNLSVLGRCNLDYTVKSLPRPSKLDKLLLIYTLPFQIKKKRGKPSFEGLSAIEAFQKFIDYDIIGRIEIAINAYAARARGKQSSDEYQQQNWHPTTSDELYRYLGVWLYMSLHPEL
jgi:hypothetical protein